MQYSLLRRANLHGFAALPHELLLKIISYFPANPVTISPASETEIIRREALLSLSEVCQNLRRVFRPDLWQRVEVYAGMRAGGKRLIHSRMSCGQQKVHQCPVSPSGGRQKPTRHFAKELLRQLNVVTIQDPSLAECVRIVDIEVNEATFRPVFDELGRCFSLFPNLHTVKIITKFTLNCKPDEGAIEAVKRGFKRKISYPQIRSAILSPSVYHLIAVCPTLESLATFEESSLLLMLIQGLTGLRELLCPLSLPSLAAIAEDLSCLQHLSISVKGCMSKNRLIETIRPFKDLRTLNIHMDFYGLPYSQSETWKQLFFSLSPRERQNLERVIYIEEYETIVIAEF